MKQIDFQFFPGWTRKAISFTIDDGIVETDRTLIGIVKPYGIKGTFNITSNFAMQYHTAEQIRLLYQGYEIANHVKYHPRAFLDVEEPTADQIAKEEFPGEEKADVHMVYPVPDAPSGMYYRYSHAHSAWQTAATAQAYIAYADAGKQELEEIFGAGSVQGFAWPYCRQENTQVVEYLTQQYAYLRTAGARFGREETTFDLPADWNDWAVNARQYNLVERGEQLEALEDTGVLKWMVFGVHSQDFESGEKWGELKRFCERFGNRPKEFWYASNIEIYRYVVALRAVVVTEKSITNPSDVTLYIKVDGRCLTLPPRAAVLIDA